jgi:CubicO group peptidase (beta-lactamase class C family)
MTTPRLSLFAALALGFAARAENAAITGALQPFVDSHSLAGAVTIVATKDKVLSVDTVGYMDVGAKKAMQPDALFWIASMSKPTTATAFMMLVDEGKVNVEDPVEKYLPEFKDVWLGAEKDKDHVLLRRPGHPIKVREILSHTSGLQPHSAIEQPTLDMVSLRVAVLSHPLMPLLFEPGTGYRYSNAGINTAGRIIEVVSGMSYEEFMQKRLFDPLGMKDTTFWPTAAQLTRLAKSYKPNEAKNDLEETPISQLHYPLDDRQRQPMPAGGLFSTAQDMAKLCQMLLNGGTAPDGKRLLSEAAIKQMTSRQTPENLKESYGFGFSTAGGTYGHGGAYATNMTVDPQLGLITVFMVQHAGFPGNGKESHGAFRKAATEAFGKK